MVLKAKVSFDTLKCRDDALFRMSLTSCLSRLRAKLTPSREMVTDTFSCDVVLFFCTVTPTTHTSARCLLLPICSLCQLNFCSSGIMVSRVLFLDTEMSLQREKLIITASSTTPLVIGARTTEKDIFFCYTSGYIVLATSYDTMYVIATRSVRM